MLLVPCPQNAASNFPLPIGIRGPIQLVLSIRMAVRALNQAIAEQSITTFARIASTPEISA